MADIRTSFDNEGPGDTVELLIHSYSGNKYRVQISVKQYLEMSLRDLKAQPQTALAFSWYNEEKLQDQWLEIMAQDIEAIEAMAYGE